MTEHNKRLIEEFSKTQYAVALIEFLEEKKIEIDKASKCKTWEETLARGLCIDLIDDVFKIVRKKEDIEPKQKAQYL